MAWFFFNLVSIIRSFLIGLFISSSSVVAVFSAQYLDLMTRAYFNRGLIRVVTMSLRLRRKLLDSSSVTIAAAASPAAGFRSEKGKANFNEGSNFNVGASVALAARGLPPL